MTAGSGEPDLPPLPAFGAPATAEFPAASRTNLATAPGSALPAQPNTGAVALPPSWIDPQPQATPAEPTYADPGEPVLPPLFGTAPARAPAHPAGWYPDYDDPGRQRYYDGSTWTEHTAPR